MKEKEIFIENFLNLSEMYDYLQNRTNKNIDVSISGYVKNITHMPNSETIIKIQNNGYDINISVDRNKIDILKNTEYLTSDEFKEFQFIGVVGTVKERDYNKYIEAKNIIIFEDKFKRILKII